MPLPRPLPAVLLLLTACSGPTEPIGFTLTLYPRFIGGQDVLATSPEMELLVVPPGGTPEVTYLGQASDGGQLTLPNIDPYAPGTIIGLLAETGGTPDAWDPGLTLAYGQTSIVEPPAAATMLDILLPKVAALAQLGDLSAARQRYQATAAVVPGGDIYLFGGQDPGTNVELGEGSEKIFVLRAADVDAGVSAFEQIDAEMPQADLQTSSDKSRARVAGTATPVMVDGEPRVLLVGGRENWAEVQHIDRWDLFDPTTGTFVGHDRMHAAHSQHLAIPFAGGEVLIFGGLGMGSWPQFPTYDLWDPSTGHDEAGDDLAIETGLFHILGSPYGADAVVCGGVVDVGDLNHFDWTPQSGCNLVHPNGEIESFDPLPVPLAAGAMAPAGDGLLVTGGYSLNVLDDLSPVVYRNTPALATAWLYREETGWQSIGAMRHARAHHRMLVLADGRVLVLGGTTEGTGIHGDLLEAVDCPELFDPTTGLFTEVDCGGAFGGADPVVASWPGEGAFVYEGFTRNGIIYDGLVRYGIVSTGPPLEP